MANRQIGALWQRKSQNGTEFMSGVVSMGVLGECQIVVFKALERRSESSPHWIMYASTTQRQNGANADAEVKADADEDIPF